MTTDLEQLTPGTILGGRYQLQQALAAGAMGTVYRALHMVTRQTVAVKVLFRHVSTSMGGIERFRREVRVASAIHHPGIVEILDAGEEEGLLFYAMELLEGESLSDWLTRTPPLEEILALMRDAIGALAEVHRAGAVHRDIKPDNFFVLATPREGTRVKLLDFGIARDAEALRATQTGFTLGTPLYMAPEQALDPRMVDLTADVWSIGVILYEIVCGEPPFLGETPQAVCIRSIQEPHDPILERTPGTSPQLAALIDHCLAKNPADRPQDAAELHRLLSVVLDRLGDEQGAEVELVDILSAEEAQPAGRSLWVLPTLMGLAGAILVLIGLIAWSLGDDSAEEASPTPLSAPLDPPRSSPEADPLSAPAPLVDAANAPSEQPGSAEAARAEAEDPSVEDDEAATSAPPQPIAAEASAPPVGRRAPPVTSPQERPVTSPVSVPTSYATPPVEQIDAPAQRDAPPASAQPATAPPATAPPASAPPASAPAAPPTTSPPATAPPPSEEAPPSTTPTRRRRRDPGFITF